MHLTTPSHCAGHAKLAKLVKIVKLDCQGIKTETLNPLVSECRSRSAQTAMDREKPRLEAILMEREELLPDSVKKAERYK